MDPSSLKKQKVEKEEDKEEEGEMSLEEQEQALVALIEHRSKEVDHLKKRLLHYKTEVCFFFLKLAGNPPTHLLKIYYFIRKSANPSTQNLILSGNLPTHLPKIVYC